MIQRVQTLYLLLASVAMSLMLIFPLGRFLVSDMEFVLTAFSFGQDHGDTANNASTIYMGILIVMTAVISFVNIFLYKNRILQVRLCYMNMVLMLGVQIFVAYYLYNATVSVTAESTNGTVKYMVTSILPLIGIILTWLANRGIMKDESLVRSLDRIR